MRILKVRFDASETEKLLHGTETERCEILSQFEQKLSELYSNNSLIVAEKSTFKRIIRNIISLFFGGVKIG